MSLEIEITMQLLSAELISQILLCTQIYTWGIINRCDLVVPTFKETSYPIEEVFQAHTDDVIDSDFSFIDSEPLDIYSKQEFSDEESQDTVYGTEEEFNTLFYDLDNDSDNEASEDLQNYQSVSQCQSLTSIPRTDSKISTFVCTQQNT